MPQPPKRNDWYPSADELRDPQRAARVVHDLYARLYRMEAEAAEMRRLFGVPKSGGRGGKSTPAVLDASALDAIASALEAGGSHQLNVDGLPGLLARAQAAGAKSGTALPPISQGHDGELFILVSGATRTLYQFTTGAPGSWDAITAVASTHGSTHINGATDPIGAGNLDAVARNGLRINSGGSTYDRRRHNVIAGSGISLSIADDAGNEEVDLTIALGALLGTNGAQYEFVVQTEEITLSTTGATTDSSANLLRATGIILGVVHYITQTISGGGVTTHSVGDPTTANRFLNASANLTAGTGFFNYRHLQLATLDLVQLSNAKLRVTCDATPTQGKIRASTLCLVMTPPTS